MHQHVTLTPVFQISLPLPIIIHACTGPSQPRHEQAAPTQQVSPPPQPPSPLVQFTSYLKSFYDRQKFPNYGKWPPCSSKKYINLACIDKYGISKGKFEKFTKASIRGNIDDIVSDKHPMEFIQIAKKLDDGSWPKLILVEGAPGVGKSTFAWKLCRKWSKGKILSQYKLVVLLKLRDKHVCEAKTLYDLIYYDNPKKQELIVEELISSDGKETLLLFEGYDELPAQMQEDEDSIIVQIVSGKRLPEATVLVTSRHSASGFIVQYNEERISQHIEILGFTKENIQTYINENVKDSEERQGLERYLSCYPHIRTMMYVPLNSVIVVEVYHQCHDKDKPAPKTMTELYTSLVHTLLIRYLTDTLGKKEVTLESLKSLKAYGVYKQFRKVCKIAYKGIANNQQIIFYKSNIPDGFQALDLMQEVHELYVDKGDCVSYNFLHLTIQEYLAAVHLSMQRKSVQVKHFQRKKTISSFVMVLRFLSGLTKFHKYPQRNLALILEPSELEPEDYRYGQSELEPEDYRYGPSELEPQSYGYRRSRLNFHWLFEAQNVEHISSVLKKDVFSVDSLSTPFEAYALGYCVAHSNLQWKSHFSLDSTMSDMLLRGLQAEETQCKGTIYEVEIAINESTQDFFKPAIKFFRRITCRITSLSFLSGVSTELVKDLSSCFDKIEIKAKNNEMKMEHCKALGELIRSSTSLRRFKMDTLPPDEGQRAELTVDLCSFLEPIVTALGQNTSLESVSFPNGLFLLAALTALMRTGRSELHPRVLQLLKDVSFDDKDGTLFLGEHYTHHPNTNAEYLSPARIHSLYIKYIYSYVGDTSFLSDLCSLSKLVIEGGILSGNNIKCITEGFLVHCKGIASKASDEEARSLVDVEGGTEQSNKTCTLEHIELTNCSIGLLEAQHLAQALRVNTSVKTLKLIDNPLSNEVAEMLGGNEAESSGTVNTSLQQLDLGAQHLAQALCVNTSVKTLDLSVNPLRDEGAKALAEMLGGNGAESSGTVNTTLEHVDLSHCRIGPVGAQHLAQALCVNTSVKTLKLCHNHLVGDEGAKALAEMLGGNGPENIGTVNTTLEHVDINSCSIGPVGAQLLAQALCVNTSVKTLDLTDNPLGVEGVKALAEMLGGNGAEGSGTVNTTLQQLGLNDCLIGSLGAQHLAQALRVNTTVKTLKLSLNPLRDEGAKALAEMLGGNGAESSGTVNTTLKHVDLSWCRIRPVGAQLLAQALRVNTSVKTLKLSNNPLGDEGAKALAEMLGGNGAESSGTVNTTLEHVDLRRCSIGPVGAQHLAQALCVNTSVTFLEKDYLDEEEYLGQLNWSDIEENLTA